MIGMKIAGGGVKPTYQHINPLWHTHSDPSSHAQRKPANRFHKASWPKFFACHCLGWLRKRYTFSMRVMQCYENAHKMGTQKEI